MSERAKKTIRKFLAEKAQKAIKKYFVAGGPVPEGKDGIFVWCEEHPNGGALVWYCKPVNREDLPAGVEEKKG
ncbi:MAG: hypothetical protein DRH12_16895 [Deltaproteobacteria bacterium]|nr:MAG: hypothetical protein DRH12_16895 [Deltaproteobacteria bacterium]